MQQHIQKLRESVKEMTVRSFDTYCGTGFYIMSRGVAELLKENPQQMTPEMQMRAVIDGVIEGIHETEKQRRGFGHAFLRSPLKQLAIPPEWFEPVSPVIAVPFAANPFLATAQDEIGGEPIE